MSNNIGVMLGTCFFVTETRAQGQGLSDSKGYKTLSDPKMQMSKKDSRTSRRYSGHMRLVVDLQSIIGLCFGFPLIVPQPKRKLLSRA